MKTILAILVLLAAPVGAATAQQSQPAEPPKVPYRADGEYRRNCVDCRTQGSTLVCRCDSRMGQARTARLDLAECKVEDKGYVRVAQVENWNGDLRCKD
jgi:hypothetical protein